MPINIHNIFMLLELFGVAVLFFVRTFVRIRANNGVRYSGSVARLKYTQLPPRSICKMITIVNIVIIVYPQIKYGVPELRAKRARESLIIEVMSSKLCASVKFVFSIAIDKL